MKDISNASKRALALSKRDQIIESFKKYKGQLKSIDANGPDDQDDIDVVQMCVKFVIAEVSFSEAEQQGMEEEL